jgi:hypothetical protein
MGFYVDLVRQVKNVLALASGGTGNRYGWGRATVLALQVQASGSAIPLGSAVYVRFPHVTPQLGLASTATAGIIGIVVGYFAGEAVVEAEAAPGCVAAVMVLGDCRALATSAVTRGHYAIRSSTPGSLADSTSPSDAVGIWAETTGAAGLARLLMIDPQTATGVRLTVAEADGSPSVPSVITLKVGDGDLTDEGLGVVRVKTAADIPVRNGALEIIVTAPPLGAICDIELPFAGVWTAWRIFNDSAGSIVYDLWRDAYANFPPTVADRITASDKPTTSGAAKAAGACTGWTTAFAAGDVVRINVDSTSGLARSVLSLSYTRT